jgi:hypothetical protein
LFPAQGNHLVAQCGSHLFGRKSAQILSDIWSFDYIDDIHDVKRVSEIDSFAHRTETIPISIVNCTSLNMESIVTHPSYGTVFVDIPRFLNFIMVPNGHTFGFAFFYLKKIHD